MLVPLYNEGSGSCCREVGWTGRQITAVKVTIFWFWGGNFNRDVLCFAL